MTPEERAEVERVASEFMDLAANVGAEEAAQFIGSQPSTVGHWAMTLAIAKLAEKAHVRR